MPLFGGASPPPRQGKGDGAPAAGFFHALFRKPIGSKLVEASSVGDLATMRLELAKGKSIESRSDVRAATCVAPRRPDPRVA